MVPLLYEKERMVKVAALVYAIILCRSVAPYSLRTVWLNHAVSFIGHEVLDNSDSLSEIMNSLST